MTIPSMQIIKKFPSPGSTACIIWSQHQLALLAVFLCLLFLSLLLGLVLFLTRASSSTPQVLSCFLRVNLICPMPQPAQSHCTGMLLWPPCPILTQAPWQHLWQVSHSTQSMVPALPVFRFQTSQVAPFQLCLSATAGGSWSWLSEKLVFGFFYRICVSSRNHHHFYQGSTSQISFSFSTIYSLGQHSLKIDNFTNKPQKARNSPKHWTTQRVRPITLRLRGNYYPLFSQTSNSQ